jgi:hypothetical protein
MYWFAVVGLSLLGLVGVSSYGAPLLVIGLALLVVFPWRTRRTVVWSTVAGSIAAVAAYVLLAPLGCTSTAVQVARFPADRAACVTIPGSSPHTGACLTPAANAADKPALTRTQCTNVLGIDYSGVGAYRANLVPALAASIAVALLVGLVASATISKPSSTLPV